MAFQLVNTRRITTGENYAEYIIDSVADLVSPIPIRPTSSVCMGSVAYTPMFDIYTLTNNGWTDTNGTVVSG